MKLSLLVFMLLDIDYRKSGRRKGPGLAKHKHPRIEGIWNIPQLRLGCIPTTIMMILRPFLIEVRNRNFGESIAINKLAILYLKFRYTKSFKSTGHDGINLPKI